MSDIQDLQRRVTWLERQHRMLLTALIENDHRYGEHRYNRPPVVICVDTRCLNGPVPHMAEQPYGCWRRNAVAGA